MPYKVLQVNVVCGYGSTGRIAVDLYRMIKESGNNCLIAYGRGEAPAGVQAIKTGSQGDFLAHVAMTRLTDKHGFYSRGASLRLIRKIQEYDPDIIHLHNIHGYYLHMGVLFEYLSKAGKPVVWTLHDCWAFTGHCAHFDYIACDKWKYLCHQCPQKNRYPRSIFLDSSRWNYKRKKELFNSVKNLTLVTPSQWLADLVKDSFLGRHPVKIINNGIDLAVFKPVASDFRKRYNLENKFIILGAAGVWDEMKGLQAFKEMALALNAAKSREFGIVLLGIDKNVKKQLPPGILGISHINDPAELAGIYSSADLFCDPTLEDSYPTVVMEALACGTPVLAYHTGGIPEQLGTGCGMTVKRGDVQELVNAVRTMKNRLSYPENRAFVREACRRHAEVHFDKNEKYRQYLDLYDSLLK